MGDLQIEVEAGEVGLDAGRLGRIDRHFAHYVDDGRLAGFLVAVSRHGELAHLVTYGQRDLEAALPVEVDTLWRMYSMTKPVTSVAALMLCEEGLVDLRDPIHRYLPAWSEPRVYSGGAGPGVLTRPAMEPIRVWHLLTHTAGLTYGFHHAHPVDALYRAAGFEWGSPRDLDLAGVCDAYAQLPLLFDPGAEWNYSVATDVLGRLVEVVSGQSLDRFFAERIFGPLGMTDAGFFVDEARSQRLAALYGPDPDGRARPINGRAVLRRPACVSGGGGMVATAGDYHRFTEMLRRRGELDGVRLLGPRTVDFMTSNHLPAQVDLAEFGRPLYAESGFDGVGFGLGVAVTIDPVKAKVPSSPGEYNWGGAASTTFWVDPVEDLSVQFLTQLLPSSTHPIRPQLKQLVYQALVD
ncbi:MAG: beta-lactamase family protein [Actinomycetota bacterium]|nr:beta-lactamase family protein [Actinomycetota bacterium]